MATTDAVPEPISTLRRISAWGGLVHPLLAVHSHDMLRATHMKVIKISTTQLVKGCN